MDILSRPVLPADHRIHYGPDPSQFGDLWIPDASHGTHFPVVVFLHGGWWKSEYDLGYAGYLCADLKRNGIATWSLEYRRVGSTGGGWPTTFQDAAVGFDLLVNLAVNYPLDLSRIVTMGHSAGGHLAFWLAGRHHIDPQSELFHPQPRLPLRAAVALAGAVDLRLTIDLAGHWTFAHDRDEVHALMGGSPTDHPERYHAGNPGDLLPLAAPQLLFQGTNDDQIPPTLPQRWADLSKRLGSHAEVKILPNADHLDLVDPTTAAWKTILAQIQQIVAR